MFPLDMRDDLRKAHDWKNPDYTPIFAERARILMQIRRDQSGRLLAACRKHYANDNPIDFIEDWGMTFDPRGVAKNIISARPFMLFDRQREFITWLHEHYKVSQPALIEKSRDMGLTWLSVAFACWLWSFKEGAIVGFGSRKQDYVDKIADASSILEKVRIFIRYLPPEFLPLGFKEADHFKFNNIVNPETGAGIIGEAGDQIGRGGRTTCYFMDEAAFHPHEASVDAALSQNTDCQFDISTANGMDNPFYEKRVAGDLDVFTFRWQEDPRKDDDWYRTQQIQMDPIDLASEVDIDYTASKEGLVIETKWVDAAVELYDLVEWPQYYAGVAGLDVGGGRDLSVFTARYGPLVDAPVDWKEGDTTDTAYKALELCQKFGTRVLNFDAIGVGAGVSSTLTSQEEPTYIKEPLPLGDFLTLPLQINPFWAGKTPTDTVWYDGKRADEKFINQKAEVWWIMRDRFQKSYEKVRFLKSKGREGKDYPLDECIAFARHSKLCAELTIVEWTRTATGKIKIKEKEELRKSPDFAESLSITFAPELPEIESIKLTGMY